MWFSLLRRALAAPFLLWAAATFVFFAIRLAPGGPFDSDARMAPDVKLQIERFYGLDKSLGAQYAQYLSNLLRGDLGPSFRYSNRSVTEIIGAGIPVSLELAAWSLCFAFIIGTSWALLAGLTPSAKANFVSELFSVLFLALPPFVVGPLLGLIFAARLGWLNAGGWNHWSDRILPVATLSVFYAAIFYKLVRAGIDETLQQDYIRTARYKGLPPSRIFLRHLLRGSMLPAVTYLGPAAAGLVGGAFVVETVFQLPGLGKAFVTASFNRDYSLVAGAALFYTSSFIVFNLLVDLALLWLNPQLRRHAES